MSEIDFNKNNKTKYICPITQEPIEKFGVLCTGSFYEYSAINEWLKHNNTDPLTNLALPIRKIYTDDINSENIKFKKDEIKQNFENDWMKLFTLPFLPYQILENVNKIKNNIRNMDQATKVNWSVYQDIKRNYISDRNYDSSLHSRGLQNPFDNDDIISRPIDTGFGYEFINLSDLNMKYKHFKSTSFNGADLSDTRFSDCDFSRCTFIGTNMTNTEFINCIFIGNEICFLDCQTNEDTYFSNCTFEKLGSWIQTKKSSEIKTILTERLLKNRVSVYCNTYFSDNDDSDDDSENESYTESEDDDNNNNHQPILNVDDSEDTIDDNNDNDGSGNESESECGCGFCCESDDMNIDDSFEF